MYVLLAALIVSITCATLIFINQKQSQIEALADFQIRAFSDLNENELAIFNGLYTAAVEINEIHNEEAEWLTVPQIEDELMPPFSRQTGPEITTDQGFISAGWKQVIAYSGEDEIKNIKG